MLLRLNSRAQRVQGILPYATEEFGVTCRFAKKATGLAGKWQGYRSSLCS
jgi:hypothetical protein